MTIAAAVLSVLIAVLVTMSGVAKLRRDPRVGDGPAVFATPLALAVLAAAAAVTRALA